MRRFVCILMALAVIFTGLSAAQSLELGDISVNPNSVWVDNDYEVKFSTKCSYNSTFVSNADVRAEIYPPGYNSPTFSPVLSYNPGSGSYDYTIGSILNDVGTYTVKFVCTYLGQQASTARQFSVHNIDLDVPKPESKKFQTFRGGQMVIDVVFKQDNMLVVPSQNTFNIKLNDQKLDQVGVPQIKNGQQEITVEIPLDDNDIRDGVYDLEVTGYSQGESMTVTLKDGVIVNAPLNIRLLNKEIVCPKGSSCNAVINAEVLFYEGYISEFTAEDNFEAVAAGDASGVKRIYINNVSCDDSTRVCSIALDIPSNLETDSYELFITVAYPSLTRYTYKGQDSMTLSTVLRLSGEMQDSRGDSVDSTMTFTNVDTAANTVIQTKGSGKYALDLLPGTYDAEIKFSSGVVVRYTGCEVSADNLALMSGNIIRYDSNNVRGGALDGLNAVATNVIEFSLPFEKASIITPYDSSKVIGDERDLQVFACSNWNFMKSSCTGKWVILPSKIHTIEDVAEFQSNFSGAFIVGEAKQIHFSNVEIPNKDYALGELVEVTGKISDMDGNLVEGADVVAVFPVENKTVKATTGRDGKFTLSISAPSVDGLSNFVLQADKEPYVGEQYKTTLNVVRKRELSVVGLPDVVEIELDKSKKIPISVFNSGQVNFTDPIFVHVTGIPSTWYNIVPQRLSDVPVGEKKNVDLELKISTAACGPDCNPYSLVTLEVGSGTYTQGASFSLKITTAVNETNVGSESPGFITGFMTGFNPSSIVGGAGLVYGGLLVVIGVLAALIYVRRSGGMRTRSGGSPAAVSRPQVIKGESLISPPTKISSLGSAGRRGGDVDGSRIVKLYRIKEQLDSANNTKK